MAVAELDDDGLAQQRQPAGRGRALGDDRHARIQALAARLVGEDDQTRSVVAPDAAQSVGDLAAPFAIDERDHVEHARRHVVTVFGVHLHEQLAQRRFDRVGGRALLAPDGVAARGRSLAAGHQIARQ